MGKIYMIALVLCLVAIYMIMISSVAESIDKSPEAVEKWLNELNHKEEKLTKLHFFLHETGIGKNQSAFPVAQPNISLTSPTFFGLVSMIDDPLTEGPSPDSTTVGRAQGLSGFSDLNEISLIMIMNFVFTNGNYNGSTLSVQGRNAFVNQPVRELAIVGGSGDFRLARGIVTTQTILNNQTTRNVVSEYNVVILHY